MGTRRGTANSVVATIVLTLAARVSATTPGVLELDETTFPKLVGTGVFDVLVKWDRAYAYNDADKAFKGVAEQVAAAPRSPHFLMASVGVQDYGEITQNKKLADAHDAADKTKWPVVRLYKRDGTVVDFAAAAAASGSGAAPEMTEASLAAFVKREARVSLAAPGAVAPLDAIASTFIGLDVESQAAKLAEARDILDGLPIDQQSAGAQYVKVMQKIIDKGDAYVAAEVARVEKILGGKLSDTKAAELRQRRDILASFPSSEGGGDAQTPPEL